MIDGPVSRSETTAGTLWDAPAREIDIPAKRGHAPMAETSRQARAAVVERGLKPQQIEVLRVLARGPATSDDIVSALSLPPNVVAPRLQELRTAGWVERLTTRDPGTGHEKTLTRKTRAGTSAAVHAATAAGIEELRKVGG